MAHINCYTCDKKLYLRPCRIGAFKKNYCNNFCRVGEKFSWLGYVYAKHRTETSKSIAEYIGIPVATLRTWVAYMNRLLPSKMQIKFRKGPEPKPEKKRTKKPKPPKVKKVAKPKKNSVTMRREPKQEPKRFKTLIVAVPQKSVRIDRRTVVMADITRTDEEVITSWYSKHAS